MEHKILFVNEVTSKSLGIRESAKLSEQGQILQRKIMRAKIFRQDIQNECKAPLLKWKDDRLEYALNGKGGNLSERVISAWNINKEAAREIDRQRAQSQASHVSQT